MRSYVRPGRIILAAAVALAGTAVGLETPGADAAIGLDNAPVSINAHLVTTSKGATTARFYHRFTNRSAVTADVVRFTVYVGTGSKPLTITESGTFSPGVAIDREDTLGSRNSLTRPVTPSCTVSYVHFTDGSSWTAPSSH